MDFKTNENEDGTFHDLNNIEKDNHSNLVTTILDKSELLSENNTLFNQLVDIYKDHSEDGISSILKLEDDEENKVEREKVIESHFQKPSSNKNSPFNKTVGSTGSYKFRYDKVLISPIHRPLNILKFKGRTSPDDKNKQKKDLGDVFNKYLKN